MSALPDSLVFLSPSSILVFLVSLSRISSQSSSSILRSITHLRIQFNTDPSSDVLPFDPKSSTHETHLDTINTLLRLVPNLRDLLLLWDGVPPRVFNGVDCSLLALTSNMDMRDFESVKFLTMQNEMRLLELPNWHSYSQSSHAWPSRMLHSALGDSNEQDSDSSEHVTFLPPDAFLPELYELSAPPYGIMKLVSGRPVRSVDVRLAGRRRSRRDVLSGLEGRRRTIGTLPSAEIDKALSSALLSPSGIVHDGELGTANSDSDYDSGSDEEWERNIPPTPSLKSHLNSQSSNNNPSISSVSQVRSSSNERTVQLEDVEWTPLMRSVSQSTAGIEDLAIATLDRFHPSVVFRAIVENVKDLKSLYLRIYTPEETTKDVCHWDHWAPYLARMPRLEVVRVEFDCHYLTPPAPTASGTTPLIQFSIPSTQCVDNWTSSSCCPSLRTVLVGVFNGAGLVEWEREGDVEMDVNDDTECEDMAGEEEVYTYDFSER